MLRCIELGKKGLGSTAPNPMVGCVITKDDIIIGEGFTSAYGGAHAEVNAIASLKDKSLLKEATLYVTLEPCSHYGNTPPCTDLIITHRIPKVVIGLEDPYEKVAGTGIKKLRATGCEVTVGVLQEKCRALHKRFLTFQEKKRPYIVLKWAETWDGFIAPQPEKRSENRQPYWISNLYSRQLTHQWRSEEQAILVGTNTALQDNPKLNVRDWAGKNPIRVIIDRHLKIPQSLNVFSPDAKTIVITEKKNLPKTTKTIVHYETVDFSGNLAEQIGAALHKHHISSVIVEGGSKTLQTFIDTGLWDEARIFRSRLSFGSGVTAPKISGNVVKTKKIATDQLTFLINA